MASSRDLKEVLKESLENRGTLGEIKARIRAEVFSALDDQSEGKPPISNDNLLIFELMREFLEYNHCKYSASVLVSEIGLSRVPLDREFLRNELNIVEDAPARSVPLLYSLISSYKDNNRGNRSQGLTQSIGAVGNHRNTTLGADNEEPEAVIVKGGRL